MSAEKVFSGNPYCPRCGHEMLNTYNQLVKSGIGAACYLLDYICENCYTATKIVTYVDPNPSIARDTDGQMVKSPTSLFFAATSACSDSRQRALT